MSEEADKGAPTIVSPTVPWEGVTVTSGEATPAPDIKVARPSLSTRRPAFNGVGPMVVARIVAPLGAAADVAVAAVRISLLHATSGSVIHHLKNGVRI
jgi:hypothetical protein